MPRDRSLLARLGPESRLLLLAAGPATAEQEIAELLRTEPVDWPLLIDLADRERATAILWRRIRRHVPTTLPAETRALFERMAMVADFQASYLEQRAGETLHCLASHGVEAIALKGTALATSVYHSFFERPMGDIDLLVERSRADEAWRIAQGAGWEWVASRYPLENYVGHAHLAPLLDVRGKALRLELHASLFVNGSPFVLSGAELEAKGTTMAIGDGEAVIPCREHLLLHACVHFAWSHMMTFGSWRAFRDVVALVEAGVDWAMFEDEAARNHAESSAYWTLRLTERLVGGEYPAATMGRLAQAAGSRWTAICERHVLKEMFPIGERCPSQLLRRVLWEQSIRPVASHHGKVRPWILDDVGRDEEDLIPSSAEDGARRARHRLTQVSKLWRYARSLAR